MKKNEFITISKVVKGKVTKSNEIELATFYKLMLDIKESFINNNTISSQLVEMIPDIKEITIDVDRNTDCDLPFVVLTMLDGEKKVFVIPRWHRIIWGLLDEFTRN